MRDVWLYGRARRLRHGRPRLRMERHRSSERILWESLRARRLGGVKFRRQVILANTIVDFFAPELRLAVEVDRAAHLGREARGSRFGCFRTIPCSPRGDVGPLLLLRFWRRRDRHIGDRFTLAPRRSPSFGDGGRLVEQLEDCAAILARRVVANANIAKEACPSASTRSVSPRAATSLP